MGLSLVCSCSRLACLSSLRASLSLTAFFLAASSSSLFCSLCAKDTVSSLSSASPFLPLLSLRLTAFLGLPPSSPDPRRCRLLSGDPPFSSDTLSWKPFRLAPDFGLLDALPPSDSASE
ncbi:hypothetical protein NP493_433g02004 [Ridgeia piscesae]|uniref:Secreted protein n=1 Tax=Ridgeia piscesae TaxID=27915 RepID=A0AAD9L0A4_RIDPI|nr:hypothetical protein NP493_433g02004 [Ridgeia piscesae]